MSNIEIVISGGNTDSRTLVSTVVKDALVSNGFNNVENSVLDANDVCADSLNSQTLLDAAREVSPRIFDTSILISDVIGPEEDVAVVDAEDIAD